VVAFYNHFILIIYLILLIMSRKIVTKAMDGMEDAYGRFFVKDHDL